MSVDEKLTEAIQRIGKHYDWNLEAFFADVRAALAEDQNCNRCGFPWSEHHGDKHAQGYICPKPSAAKERKG